MIRVLSLLTCMDMTHIYKGERLCPCQPSWTVQSLSHRSPCLHMLFGNCAWMTHYQSLMGMSHQINFELAFKPVHLLIRKFNERLLLVKYANTDTHTHSQTNKQNFATKQSLRTQLQYISTQPNFLQVYLLSICVCVLPGAESSALESKGRAHQKCLFTIIIRQNLHWNLVQCQQNMYQSVFLRNSEKERKG